MRLRVAIVLLLAWAALPAAEAQQGGKVYRVGFLGNSTAALEANLVGPFREGLRELGYVEGQNADFATRNRIPGVYAYTELVDAGGLMSFGPSYAEMHKRAAYFVDKILKGAKPADLPMEQPAKFELVINLKTTKFLGLTVPQSLLLRADRVVE
jgi:hypothetical protein